MIYDGKLIDFVKIKEHLRLLPGALAGFIDSICAVLLFGSFAKDQVTPLSDIDIAILYSSQLQIVDLDALHRKVYEVISDTLQTDEIDLINLNTAPLSMQYGAIREAKILLLNNRSEYVNFWEHTVKYYLDFKPLLDECNQVLLETLTGRTTNG